MTLTGTICVRHELNGPFLARLRLAQQQPPEIPDDVLSYDEIYNDIVSPLRNSNNLNEQTLYLLAIILFILLEIP